MLRFVFILFTTALTYLSANGQDSGTLLKTDAIKIDRLDSLDNAVYDLLHSNKLIMVGEMHGTNEPAGFVTGLTSLFSANGDSLQVGFEIPSELMLSFLKNRTDSSVYQSEFFSVASADGRASTGWASAILLLNRDPKVSIFFYDINSDESKTSDNRDSLIYIKIKKQIIQHPTWTTITLGGNIHNMRSFYKQKHTAGVYLSNDTVLNISDKFCSLNHYYQSGTMLNNIGKGLELREVENLNSNFSKFSGYDNYLYLFPVKQANIYNGAFFTRTVTAAKLPNQK
ncbi:MAG: hypothetical protein WAQ28_17765 [Bacteroidia bacterium]|jgi:hypothetical protein